MDKKLKNAIERSELIIDKYMIEKGIPGLVAGVSLKGKQVWVKGFGFSDIENGVKCHENTVMRICSITKTLGTILVSKLVEENKLKWDSNIYEYISEDVFPKHQWEGKSGKSYIYIKIWCHLGENVKITLRQLVTHVSGIRSTENRDFTKVYDFHNVTETLTMFANEPLIAKPETQFYYSNFGWQLIGAIVESATNQRYETLINEMFDKLGMNCTQMESRSAIIPHRSRQYYGRNENNKFHLYNTNIIDDIRPFPNWPCGAGLSTVPDLLTYANVLLNNHKQGGFLSSTTVNELWNYKNPNISFENRPIKIDENLLDSNYSYAMGWEIYKFSDNEINGLLSNVTFIHHYGSINGATAILGIFPEFDISIAIITNFGGLTKSLHLILLNILQLFIK